MQKINSERGITSVILVITIIVLVLISIPVIISTTDVNELQKYTYFKGDIDKLREAIETTYADSNAIATIGPKYTGNLDFLDKFQNDKPVKNPNDNENYYVISLKELNSHLNAQISLKYGSGNKVEDYASLEINQGKNPNDSGVIQYEYQGDDTYIINEQSKTIYYTKGIGYKEKTYYRLPEDFTKVSEVYTIIYDSNGYEYIPDMQTVDVDTESSIILKDLPEREGYIFKGWKEEKSGTIYQPGNSYNVKENTKFIAQWQKN